MVPWFDTTRLRALRMGSGAHLRSLARLQIPPHGIETPLASAVHGPGLMLMTGMAASGTLYYFVDTGISNAGGLVGLTITVYKALASLV